ncbi:hypothetical protein CRYUN_Cryun13aG0042100 [Craigia yunnanensis]
MADLFKLMQRPGKTVEVYIARLKKAKHRCKVALIEQEFVSLTQNDLDIDLRKTFESMKFGDFVELYTKVARYESLLREKAQRKQSSYDAYYHYLNFELGMTEVVGDQPMICQNLVNITYQID